MPDVLERVNSALADRNTVHKLAIRVVRLEQRLDRGVYCEC